MNTPRRNLSPKNAVPLYHQLFLSLRMEILAGQRPAGSFLPGEIELAQQFGVSRVTARRALNELAREGLVDRKRRSGTQVTPRTITAPIEASIEQAVEALLSFGRNSTARVLSLGCEPAGAEAATLFGLNPGETIVRARRIRLLEGSPLGVVTSEVPLAVAGDALTRARLESEPILAVLSTQGWHAANATQSVSAHAADAATAAQLAIDVGAPLLRIERVVSDGHGKPFLHTVATYRADRYRLRIDLGSHVSPEPSIR